MSTLANACPTQMQMTVSTVEGLHCSDYLFDAVHSPQMLSVRHSRRLDVVSGYYKRIVSRPKRERSQSDSCVLQRQSLGLKIVDVNTAPPAELSPIAGTPIARGLMAEASATQSPMMDVD